MTDQILICLKQSYYELLKQHRSIGYELSFKFGDTLYSQSQ